MRVAVAVSGRGSNLEALLDSLGITTEQLGQMLETMGLSPRANKNKEGKILGYYVEQTVKAGKANFYFTVSGTGSETTVWVDTNVAVFGDQNPATVSMLTGLLAEQDNLWPAYFVYYPKTKILQLAMPLQNANPTAAMIRKTMDDFAAKCNTVLDVLAKEMDKEKAKADENKEKGSQK